LTGKDPPVPEVAQRKYIVYVRAELEAVTEVLVDDKPVQEKKARWEEGTPVGVPKPALRRKVADPFAGMVPILV
jgi:hypothetical protein